MKFEANRLSMLEAAQNVSKIVPHKSTTEILRNVLVESNADVGEIYLTATNHEVSIQQKVSATVSESGEMLINSRFLVGMMDKLEGEFVSVSADSPEVMKITAGRCVFNINCQSSEKYPKPIMPYPGESVIMTGICSLAKRTVFAVGDTHDKLVLQCVKLKLKNNALQATACDGVRMMLVKDIAEPTDEKEFLLPGRALQILASLSEDSDVFEVSEIGNEIVFVRGDMIFTIRKLNTGSYIDTNALLKRIKPEYFALVDAAKMKEALNTVSVAELVDNTRMPVNIVLRDKEIFIHCDNDYSEADSVVSANVTKITPADGFYYDGSALLKLFQILSGKVKIEIDAGGFMFVKTPQ